MSLEDADNGRRPAPGLARHRALRSAIGRIDIALDTGRLWPLVKAFAEDRGYEYLVVLDATKLSHGPEQATIHTNLSSGQIQSILESSSAQAVGEAFQSPEPLTLDANDTSIKLPVLRGKALAVPIHGTEGAALAGVIYAGENADVSMSTRVELYVVAHAAYDRHLAVGESKSRASNGSLSQRETDCIRLASLGKSDREIGQELNISTSTVRFHMDGAKSKLGVKSRVAAVVTAMREKFIGLVAGVLSLSAASTDAEAAVGMLISG